MFQVIASLGRKGVLKFPLLLLRFSSVVFCQNSHSFVFLMSEYQILIRSEGEIEQSQSRLEYI